MSFCFSNAKKMTFCWHFLNFLLSFFLQSGETALHVAARYGNVDVVSYLCSIRANPDLADRVSMCTKSRAHNKAETRFYMDSFAFPSSGAGDPSALRCLARILCSIPSTVPGWLSRGRQEPRGRDSAADGVCSGLCWHRGVSGGAQGQPGSDGQGKNSNSSAQLWLIFHFTDYFWCDSMLSTCL